MLNVSENALEFLSHAGFDPIFGARPLRRVIQQRLENPLARGLLSGDLGTANEIYVDGDQRGLTIATSDDENLVVAARKAS